MDDHGKGGDMFGHQDDQSGQEPAQIPEQSIDEAMGESSPATAVASLTPVVQPTAPLPMSSPAPAADTAADPSAAATAPVTPSDEPADDTSDANDLIDIKQQALTQLSPLIGHLDQSPEEKFRTTMMMIQASDNQALIRSAFAAAQNIPDEKARAQALLDIVNEINYFTQHHDS